MTVLGLFLVAIVSLYFVFDETRPISKLYEESQSTVATETSEPRTQAPEHLSAIASALSRSAVDARLSGVDLVYASDGLEACQDAASYALNNRSQNQEPRRFAVLAGINDYGDRELNLHWSLYDVYKFGRYADNAGFD